MIAINNISRDLHARFDGFVDTHVVDAVFKAVLADHLERATVTTWVPLLAGREAAAELERMSAGTLEGVRAGTLVAA